MPSVNTMFNFGLGGGGSAPMSSYPQTPTVAPSGDAIVSAGASIDGTPTRVVTIIVLSVLGLAGLKWAGYRFNVTSG
jgi:hypothetical protein